MIITNYNDFSPDLQNKIEKGQAQHDAILAQIIAEGQVNGEFNKLDPLLQAQFFNRALYSLLLHNPPSGKEKTPEWAQILETLIFHGISAQGDAH